MNIALPSSPPLEDLLNVIHRVEQKEMVAANKRTLKDLVALALDKQPLCVEYPAIEVAFDFKSRMLHLLPMVHVIFRRSKQAPQGVSCSVFVWNQLGFLKNKLNWEFFKSL